MPPVCPSCNSSDIWKRGFYNYKQKMRLYSCKPCKKRFTENSVSKFSRMRCPESLIKYISNMHTHKKFSPRKISQMMADRNINLSHVSVFKWTKKFTPLEQNAQKGTVWIIDCQKANFCGNKGYLYTIEDDLNNVISIRLSNKNNQREAEEFIKTAVVEAGSKPDSVTGRGLMSTFFKENA